MSTIERLLLAVQESVAAGQSAVYDEHEEDLRLAVSCLVENVEELKRLVLDD